MRAITQCFCTFISLLSLTLHAEVAPPKEIPVLTKTAGQIVKAVWRNGNEAHLKAFRTEAVDFPVPMEVTENFCKAQVGQKVLITAPVRVDFIGWVWAKHQNPEKIGKVLRYSSDEQNMGGGVQEFHIITNTRLTTHPNLRYELRNDRLKMQVSQMTDALADQEPFIITSWIADAMLFNPETGGTENRTFGVGFNIQLTPLKELEYEISSYGKITSLTPDFSLVGTVVSWYLQDGPRLCQITFSPDPSMAGQLLTELLTKAFTHPQYQEYLWESDDLSKLVNKSFFNGLENYE